MDIHSLKVFESVYRNRSFSRASEELNLSQPTVSEHVKHMEEELGKKLFDRVGRRVMPTREGEDLYERAVEIIERFNEIKSDIIGVKDEVRGLLTVGASHAPGSYVVPHLAAEFRIMHPEVFFQVQIEDAEKIEEMVAGGELFVGFVDRKSGRPGLDYMTVIEDELVLAAPPGLIAKDEINPMELSSVPLLLRDEGSGARKAMDRSHTEHGVRLDGMKVAAVLGSTDSLREAVKSGLGASILSRFAIRDDLKAGSIVEVRIKGVRMKRDFYVVTNKKRTLPNPYAAFFVYLKEELSSEGDG